MLDSRLIYRLRCLIISARAILGILIGMLTMLTNEVLQILPEASSLISPIIVL